MCTHVLMSVCILTEDTRSGSETKSVDYLRQKQKPEQSLASVLWVPIPTRRCAGQMVPNMQWGVSKRAPHPSQVRKLILSRATGDLLTVPSGERKNLNLYSGMEASLLGERETWLSWNGSRRQMFSLFSGQEAVLSSDQERDSVFSCKGVLLCRHPWKDCQVLLPNSCSKVRYSWRIVFWERPPGIKWGA